MDASAFTPHSPGRLVAAFDGSPAFVPDPVPRELAISTATWRKIVDAERAVAGLQGVLAGLSSERIQPTLVLGALIRREALVSSRIEGTLSSARQLALFESGHEGELGSRSEVDSAREVANYLRALEFGLSEMQRLPLGARLIRALHAHLMDGVRGGDETPGEFRRVQNFIGSPGQSLKEARFVPPPPSALDVCIADLERAMHEREDSTALPLLARLALLHYQFECIHPFRDGNGRVGRLLIPLVLRQHRPDCPLVLVSEQLEPQRQRYYDLMLDVSRRGAWTEWIDFFLEALARSATDHQRRALELLQLRERWRAQLSTARSSAALLRVVDALFERPSITRQQVSALLDISTPAASKMVERLVVAGVLLEASGRQRGQVFVAPALLELGSGD
jgi:Fic family protein